MAMPVPPWVVYWAGRTFETEPTCSEARRLEDLSPALTADDIERPSGTHGSQPDFREANSRQIRVIGIGGPEGWSSAAVLVRDEFRNYNEVDPELVGYGRCGMELDRSSVAAATSLSKWLLSPARSPQH